MGVWDETLMDSDCLQESPSSSVLMKKAFDNLKGDLAGTYFPLTGMSEKVRQQLVDDHFLFVSGDRNLTVAGMERYWPEVVESSTMTPRPSLCGSTRRTRPVSSPWRREAMSRESSPVSPVVSRPLETVSRLSLARTTPCPSSTATSTPAPPTSVLA